MHTHTNSRAVSPCRLYYAGCEKVWDKCAHVMRWYTTSNPFLFKKPHLACEVTYFHFMNEQKEP